MALPLAIPTSPSGGNSPSSTDGSNGPQTPLTPDTSVQTLALPPPTDSSPTATNTSALNNAAAKRKPSRRANTAERRATHNAVERQRRETLNGRFLDLAALLPNLSQIRRPSKSSIVNSSIAHIHASRRHRLLAARELRLIKLESDALRRELNEWRDRSGLPRVEEPVRGDAFQMILSGEVEVLSVNLIEEEDGSGEYGADEYGDDDFGGASGPIAVDDISVDDVHMRAPMAHAAAVALLKNGEANPFAHNVSGGGQNLGLQTMIPRSARGHVQTPMIVQSPTSVSFENPAMAALYDSQHGGPLSGPQYPAHYLGNANQDDKSAVWGAQLYGGMPTAQGQMFTPPASSHGAAQGPQQAAFLMNLQRHQALLQQQQQQQRAHNHAYGSPPDGDDASSVGSASGGQRRERSGSMGSNGSGYGSSGSNPGYDMAGAVPRRMPGGQVSWDDGLAMNIQMMKGAPIAVGGGGNGHGYGSMML
ncbi:hypothetical protein B0H21DRAFT_9025 [Amylocystis lapponica]|nr:hypothetical protein B0H21DRAFT_9025 [Amylocystis lapponica]